MLAAVLSLLAVASTVAAQLPSAITRPAPPAPATQEQPSDPLGRSTPRGTIRGFVKAAERNDFVTAAQYLQATGRQKETLARDLKELMNRYFSEPLALISDSPEGTPDDGLPLDRERVGPLKINDNKIDILLVRVADPQSGRIWLISSDTLANVPELFDEIEENWLDRFMPEVLLNHALFSISLAQWIVWLASIAVPFLLLWFVSPLTLVILRRTVYPESRRPLLESWYTAVRGPVVFILTVIVHLLVVYSLSLSLTSRIIYGRFALILLIVGVVWMLRRIMNLSFARVRSTMDQKGDTGTQSLVLLAERLLRVVITLVAIFSILTIAGVDTKTALAGVGIGGVAIAFGAQKTVENLLGGIFLLTDKALAIGDKCRVGDRVGTVEDITLRSIRLRTPEQTLVSIPAGALSQSNIENFATRRKIPVETTLELRCSTTTEQLKNILELIRRLLVENPRLETATARVQLISYGPSSIQLELVAYVTTPDEAEFRTVREDLLLHIGEVVDNSGSGFAAPAQLFYIRSQGETHPERTSVSEVPGPGGKVQEASRDPGRTSEVQRALPPSLPAEGQVLPKRAS
ncbi:MAG: mechanosensitive ion channel family protein [Terriglobales bacterium]